MKRIFSILLAACLCMSCMAAFGEEVPSSFENVMNAADKIYSDMLTDMGYDNGGETLDFVNNLFVIDGKMYTVGYNRNAFYMGDDDWVRVELSLPDEAYDGSANYTYSIPGGKAAYGIRGKYDQQTGDEVGFEIIEYTVLEDGTVNFQSKSVVPWEDNIYNKNLSGATGDDSTMYVLMDDYSAGHTVNLYKFDIATGAKQEIADLPLACGITELNGKLYILCLDTSAVWDDKEGKVLPYIAALDKDTGAEDVRITLPVSTSVMQLTTDGSSLYYRDMGAVYKVDAGLTQVEKVAYVSVSDSWNNGNAVVWNGKFCTPGEKLSMVSVNQEEMQKTVITLSNGFYDGGNIISQYIKLHPDVAIVNSGRYYNDAESYRSNMQSNYACDIYSLQSSSSEFKALRDKGYMLDLSSNGKIAEIFGRMYPNLTAQCTDGSKIYALPYSIDANSWACYPDSFKRVGISEEDMPKTIMDYLNFLEKYVNEIQKDYPEMQLFQWASEGMKYQVLQMAMQQQLMACQMSGAPMRINTPQMQQIMQKIESMQPVWDAMDQAVDENNNIGVMYSSDMGPNYLLEDYYNILPGDSYRFGNVVEKEFLLSIDESTPAYLMVRPSCMFVNPYSKNADAAIDFLAYLMENLSDVTKVRMFADENDPLERPDYQRQSTAQKKALELYKDQYDKASDEEKETWQMYIDSLNQNLQYVEEQRWNISPEEIEEYAELEPRIVVVDGDSYFGSNPQINTTAKRYVDGQINGMQYLKEIDRIMEMIALENK